MRYVSVVVLAVTLFTASLVFAQGEKIDPVLPADIGLATKEAVGQTVTPVLLPDAGPASTEVVGQTVAPVPPAKAVPASKEVVGRQTVAPVPPPNAGPASKEVVGQKITPASPPKTRLVSKKRRAEIGRRPYLVGIADVLDINVITPVPITSTMTVTSDGTITFPYIGNVLAQGRTLSQIQSEIQNRLGRYMDYPVVSVSLKEAQSKKFTIYGAVLHPGPYLVGSDMTILRAISLAGGLNVAGSTGMVRILRPNKNGRNKSVIFESDITALLNGTKQDLVILAGDTVVVTIDNFFIYGEVNHPGSYSVQENMSLLNAITMAGGFIESGSVGKIKIFRAKPRENENPVLEFDVNSALDAASQNAIVRAGDTIVVSLDKFFVTGQVNHPGAYPVEDHMSLLDAISTAGGLTADNSTANIKLLRNNAGGEPEQQFETDFTSVLNGTAPDVSVRALDTIIVTANKFYVYGEVTRPGVYSLESKTTALSAIAIAGGFSKFGSVSRVKVLRINQKTGSYEIIKVNITEAIAGNSNADVQLMPGDVVVVSEGIF